MYCSLHSCQHSHSAAHVCLLADDKTFPVIETRHVNLIYLHKYLNAHAVRLSVPAVRRSCLAPGTGELVCCECALISLHSAFVVYIHAHVTSLSFLVHYSRPRIKGGQIRYEAADAKVIAIPVQALGNDLDARIHIHTHTHTYIHAHTHGLLRACMMIFAMRHVVHTVNMHLEHGCALPGLLPCGWVLLSLCSLVLARRLNHCDLECHAVCVCVRGF